MADTPDRVGRSQDHPHGADDQASPEPPTHLAAPTELLTAYLDLYRANMPRKIEGLDETEPRHSRLAPDWTPLELVKKLSAPVER